MLPEKVLIRNQNLELQKNIYIALLSIVFDAPVADHNVLFNIVMKPRSVLLPRINQFTFSVFIMLFLPFSRLLCGYFSL